MRPGMVSWGGVLGKKHGKNGELYLGTGGKIEAVKEQSMDGCSSV